MRFVYLPYRRNHLGKKETFYTVYADEHEAIDAVESSIDFNVRSRYRYDLSGDNIKVDRLDTSDCFPDLYRWNIYRVSPSGDVAICEIYGIEKLQLKEKES